MLFLLLTVFLGVKSTDDCHDNGAPGCAILVDPMTLEQGEDGRSYFWVLESGNGLTTNEEHNHDGAEATYYFECTEDTDIQISMESTTPTTKSNSVFISMDDVGRDDGFLWHLPFESAPTWQTTQDTFSVTEGIHRLHIWNREDGVKVYDTRIEGDVCHFLDPYAPRWCEASSKYMNHKGSSIQTINRLESIEACQEECDAREECNFVWFFASVGTRPTKCRMWANAHKWKPRNPTDTRDITYNGRFCSLVDMSMPCVRDEHCHVDDVCDADEKICRPAESTLMEVSVVDFDNIDEVIVQIFAAFGLAVVLYGVYTTLNKVFCGNQNYARL